MIMGQRELLYLLAVAIRYLLECGFFVAGICAFLRYLKLHPKDKK